MPALKNQPAKAGKPKLRLTRVFAAPRAVVFAAWTKPEHLKRWSAPHGFKIPENEGELRAGGPWRAVMVMPDGTKLTLGGKYTKIVPDELLQFTHRWEGEPGPETLVTVRFTDAPGGGTKLVFEQAGFDSSASRDGHLGGWKECFERLDTLLLKLTDSKPARGRTKK
jgi:uncharacterized protein YndB with AHSA1/START domain